MPRARHLGLAAIALLLAVSVAEARDPLARENLLAAPGAAGSFPLVARGEAMPIVVDQAQWPGVARAAADLQADIERVTGRKAAFTRTPQNLGRGVVVVGTVGKGGIIDALAAAGKIDAKPLTGKWESFAIETVTGPFSGIAGLENVQQALVIAGSDKRGAIFGIYEISEQIGVSPWYWWADVPPRKAQELHIRGGRYFQGEPGVKYRGIFLNDEAPDLSNWVREKYGTVPGMNNVSNYNSEFYARIFEAILRCRGNYLWPAMWNNAFNEDDPKNAPLADEFGVVMGTSHQEPMIRAQKEWDRRNRTTWNYFTDAKTLQDFWREGIRRNKNYESILTLGLRGANDTPMIRGGTVQQNIDLLNEIFAAQRKMIAEEMNPDPSKIPQLWCPYKEVLEYYNAGGIRVPDDVTILWTDDNWGNIRRFPTEAERKRSGGAGVYYHFDYVGGPRNYKWVNTNPIPKVWEQMTRAKLYGADRVWIVNVGHFKGVEFPMEFWFRMGWETDRWTNDNLDAYTQAWAAREFGEEYAKDIAEIITGYTRFNGRRKPELLDPTTFSLVHYQEAERVNAEWEQLVVKGKEIHEKLAPEKRDAFYQLAYFPAKACAQVTALYIAAGRNALYAQQGRASTNEWAAKVREIFAADAALMDEFHKHAGGKWNYFMDQVHIGYTSWQDPQRNVMPRVTEVTPEAGASLGLALEGSQAAATAGAEATLPKFDAFAKQRRWVDVFNKGSQAFEYTASPSDPWIVVSEPAGTIQADRRLWISVDWSKAPEGAANGTVKVSRAGGETFNIKVEAFNPPAAQRNAISGYVESNGVVAMEADGFTASRAAGDVKWSRIDSYGKTRAGMVPLPMTTPAVASPAAGRSPCLEYKVHTFSSGEVKLWAFVGASLNSLADQPLRYAVSIDDESPQVIEIVPGDFNASNGNRRWETSVKDNGYYLTSTHRIAAAGAHTVKLWMVDPGVVVERLVLDLGGMKTSYLGPPQSPRVGPAAAP